MGRLHATFFDSGEHIGQHSEHGQHTIKPAFAGTFAAALFTRLAISCAVIFAAALRKIAEAKTRFVDFHGVGSRELAYNLWRASGVETKGDWVLKDGTVSKFDILQFARTNNAYVIVGYIPARLGKMNSAGMEILVQGDPAMRRPFIVMEANPKKFPNANHAGARALSDFLLSPKVQTFLADFGQKTTSRGPLFHPVQ